MVDQKTMEFLAKVRYISLYCPICEGEFDLEEALQVQGHPDYVVLSGPDLDDNTVFNLVCPEEHCQHPQLEVIIGK